MHLLGLGWPVDAQLAMLSHTISEIQIDEALIRNSRLICHALEISNDIFAQAHSDRLLELGGIGFLRKLIFERSYSVFIIAHRGNAYVRC